MFRIVLLFSSLDGSTLMISLLSISSTVALLFGSDLGVETVLFLFRVTFLILMGNVD